VTEDGVTADGDRPAEGAAARGPAPASRHARPEVSVLIPVRNGMPHLSTQLAALARQTYRGPWEAVVSDNGSTDGSLRVIEAARAQLPLRLVDSRQATGRSGALAVAAGAARGRLLLFCDADDVVADDWVERMVAALERHPAVGGYLDEDALNPPSVRAWRPPATPGELPAPFGLLPAPIGANCGVWREAYEKVGGFDQGFRGAAAEETDLFWRLQLAGYRLGYAPAAVVAYRHRATLPSMLRQWRGYGRGRAHLAARYQALGLLPAESWRDAADTSGWLAVHLVDCVRGPVRRVNYLRTLAHVIGQVEGSREAGALHIRRNPRPGTVHRPPGVPGEMDTAAPGYAH
jgi:GT2 family glycosyltransferase